MVDLAFPAPGTFPTPPPYYSTQPFLAWAMNHWVYGGKHYVWASRYFLPYRLTNPKSSNPYEMYRDLYLPSRDNDRHDPTIRQKRINLRAGVEAVVRANPSHPFHHRAADLFQICDQIEPTFFWPVLYLVDGGATAGGILANSALLGSEECLVTTLHESTLMVVFPDFDREPSGTNLFARFFDPHGFDDRFGFVDGGLAIDELLAHS
jgi:hypothetical protein